MATNSEGNTTRSGRTGAKGSTIAGMVRHATFEVPGVRISLVREPGIRLTARPHVPSSAAAARIFRSYIPEDADREYFVMAILNVRRRLIAMHTVSIGCATGALVHPREIFRTAILAGGVYICLAHNHVSGNAEPSRDDVSLTERIEDCGVLLGIELYDHIVLGEHGRCVSLRRRGLVGKRHTLGWIPGMGRVAGRRRRAHVRRS